MENIAEREAVGVHLYCWRIRGSAVIGRYPRNLVIVGRALRTKRLTGMLLYLGGCIGKRAFLGLWR